MAFEMGSVPKDPIDVRHFSLLYQFLFSFYNHLYPFVLILFIWKREKFILIRIL
jgi:hypothetical protein